MKTFIGITVAAFLSAGIYGFIDMARDVNKGTYISYPKNDEPEKNVIVPMKKTIVNKDGTKKTVTYYMVKPQVVKKKKKKKKIIDAEEYSRGSA
ncbi:MAG: hypothetical protein HY064_07520 [Bacteroidetes bacterium]|nr:hypothetical protein [Bacteroidota bacterium]